MEKSTSFTVGSRRRCRGQRRSRGPAVPAGATRSQSPGSKNATASPPALQRAANSSGDRRCCGLLGQAELQLPLEPPRAAVCARDTGESVSRYCPTLYRGVCAVMSGRTLAARSRAERAGGIAPYALSRNCQARTPAITVTSAPSSTGAERRTAPNDHRRRRGARRLRPPTPQPCAARSCRAGRCRPEDPRQRSATRSAPVRAARRTKTAGIRRMRSPPALRAPASWAGCRAQASSRRRRRRRASPPRTRAGTRSGLKRAAGAPPGSEPACPRRARARTRAAIQGRTPRSSSGRKYHHGSTRWCTVVRKRAKCSCTKKKPGKLGLRRLTSTNQGAAIRRNSGRPRTRCRRRQVRVSRSRSV